MMTDRDALWMSSLASDETGMDRKTHFFYLIYIFLEGQLLKSRPGITRAGTPGPLALDDGLLLELRIKRG